MPVARKPKLIEFRDKLSVSLYHFESIGHGAVLSTNVDRANGIIRRVAVITDGVTARGHDMEVDQTTVRQLHGLGRKKGKVSVKLDHGSGMTSVCGYLTNFVMQGKKLLADWFLLKSHKEYETTLERAEEMPECFGMSAAFMGGPVLENGAAVYTDEKTEKQYTVDRGGKKSWLTGEEKKLARATELRAVDCVTDPAANPGGLFSEKIPGVDKAHGRMPKRNATDETEITGEPTIGDLARLLTEMKSGQEQFQQDMTSRMEAIESGATPKEYEIEELEGMSDKQLKDIGLTRQDIISERARIDELLAEQETEAGGGNANTQENGGGASNVPAAVQSELASLHRTVNFMVRERDAEKREQKRKEMETYFDSLDEKFDKAQARIVELEAKCEAQDIALKTGGGKPIKNNSQEVVLFATKNGKPVAPAGTFEHHVTIEFNRLREKGIGDVAARGQAMTFAVKNHAQEYVEFRQRGGKFDFSKLTAA